MKNRLLKILNIVADIAVVLIFIVSVFTVMLSLTAKSSGVSNIFGIAPMSVESDSMKDTLKKGDLILCNVTDGINDTFSAGDIVTFPINIQGVKTYNTHRIVEVVEKNGITYYRTQGDNSETNPAPDSELQTSATIVARYTGKRIPRLGSALSFIKTQLGFFLCVLLPMIIFFIYQTVRVIVNILGYYKEKAVSEAKAALEGAELTEEQKKKAIAEYLASKDNASEDENA